ncbi:hypothetical protein B0A54_09813 [Friedmanniomyces endolithicus]|uniref:Uncharacterized protein n=1 Tax=Friedmanniomyces endolithicus TaxID=329885 RepID=A0A4U0UPG3_9PEZI|nr:hypothetical protein B0A54_09813 [Friedmanniomyces endolithicus]
MADHCAAYVTFAPELQKQQLERQGIFQDEHTHEQQQKQEHVISDAILSDIREAEKKITGPSKKGAFWGLREAIWGGAKQQTTIAAVAAAPVPATAQEKPVGQERGDITSSTSRPVTGDLVELVAKDYVERKGLESSESTGLQTTRGPGCV